MGEAPLDEGAGAALLELVGEAAPELALEVELAVGGVNGTVTPRPGSLVFGTLAANAAKVLLPVVGGLIAPYMLGGGLEQDITWRRSLTRSCSAGDDRRRTRWGYWGRSPPMSIHRLGSKLGRRE